MNKLPTEALELLEEARRVDQAAPADLERNLQALHGTLMFSGVAAAQAATGAANAAALKSTAPAAKASTLLAGKGAKMLLASVVLGGAIGMQLVVGPAPERRPRPPEVVATQAAETRSAHTRAAETRGAETPSNGAATKVELAGDTLTHEIIREPEPRGVRSARTQVARSASRARRVTAGERPRSASGPLETSASTSNRSLASAPAAPTTVAAVAADSATEGEPLAAQAAPHTKAREAPKRASELDLIDGALLRLRAHDGQGALALLGEHQQRFVSGKFALERQALRVLALCELGRTSEGRAEKATFLARSPDAPIAARVRRACEGER